MLSATHALDNRTRISKKRTSLGSKLDHLALPHEKPSAKLSFESRDGVAYRRLDNMTDLGRLRKPTHVGHGNEVLKLANLHEGTPLLGQV